MWSEHDHLPAAAILSALRQVRRLLGIRREEQALSIYLVALLLVWRFAAKLGLALPSSLRFLERLAWPRRDGSRDLPDIRSQLHDFVHLAGREAAEGGDWLTNCLDLDPEEWDVAEEAFGKLENPFFDSIERVFNVAAEWSPADLAKALAEFIDSELDSANLERLLPDAQVDLVVALLRRAERAGKAMPSVFELDCQYGGLLAQLPVRRFQATATSKLAAAIARLRLWLAARSRRESPPAGDINVVPIDQRPGIVHLFDHGLTLAVCRMETVGRRQCPARAIKESWQLLEELLEKSCNKLPALIFADLQAVHELAPNSRRDKDSPEPEEDMEPKLFSLLELIVETRTSGSRRVPAAALLFSTDRLFMPECKEGEERQIGLLPWSENQARRCREATFPHGDGQMFTLAQLENRQGFRYLDAPEVGKRGLAWAIPWFAPKSASSASDQADESSASAAAGESTPTYGSAKQARRQQPSSAATTLRKALEQLAAPFPNLALLAIQQIDLADEIIDLCPRPDAQTTAELERCKRILAQRMNFLKPSDKAKDA